ncbi:YraN family protein [Lacrimispora sp. NSJ-141]|uniref:UPF0102 protein LQE92_08425 n=1 Tax=Lientehia hominis TaxID=2897778 RepID=A0AAP2RIH0_9FIRM|nr:YraN family protein [Lientehia hominis]MCD2492652.1 YraN family protein [Lientehia hominis]
MNRRQIGVKYEELAARILCSSGYRILERNFRCRLGEIDIIARHRGYLVFIEVKYRKDAGTGYPEEAVDVRKQTVIRKTAEFYMKSRGYGLSVPCRFDVVSMEGEQIRIIEDAFWTY